MVTLPGAAQVDAIAVQPDGRILVAGRATTGAGSLLLVRLNPDGTLDGTFAAGGVSTTTPPSGVVGVANQLAVGSDGKILAGATLAQGPGSSTAAALRFLPNGSLDSSYGTGGTALAPSDPPTGAATLLPLASGSLALGGGGGASGQRVFLARLLGDPPAAPSPAPSPAPGTSGQPPPESNSAPAAAGSPTPGGSPARGPGPSPGSPTARPRASIAASGRASSTRRGAQVVVDTGERVDCPPGGAACAVSVVAQTTLAPGQASLARALPRAPRRAPKAKLTVTVGRTTLTVSAGHRSQVTFVLNAKGTKLLRRLHHAVVKVMLSARAGAGSPTTATTTISINAPAPAPHPAKHR